MKKYVVFLLAALFVFSVSILAQDQVKKANVGIENRVEKMVTELGLTDVQKENLKSLLIKQEAEVKKLKSELNSEGDDFKAKMKELHQTHVKELKKLIGEEKYNTFRENRAAEKDKIEAAKANM